jgi:hypothetical protein
MNSLNDVQVNVDVEKKTTDDNDDDELASAIARRINGDDKLPPLEETTL